MKIIPLTQGYHTIVDDSDYGWLTQHRWKVLKAGTKCYAARTIKSPGSKHNDVTLLMHKELLPGYTRVDHKNGDGLDNQRQNLRPANASLNAANSPIKSQGTSKFKGVYWNRKKRKWQAQIRNGKSRVKYLGRFDNETEAALAYDTEARKRFGEFAILNFQHP